jgi:hypothetical protein
MTAGRVGGILLLYYNQPSARTRREEGQVTIVRKFSNYSSTVPVSRKVIISEDILTSKTILDTRNSI